MAMALLRRGRDRLRGRTAALRARGLPRRLRRSTPLRLATLLVLLFSVVSLLSFGGTYLVIRNNLYASMRSDLEQTMASYAAAPSGAALAALISNQAAATDPSQRILSYRAPDGEAFGNVALGKGPEGFVLLDLGKDRHGDPRQYMGLAGNFFGGQLVVAESRHSVTALGEMFRDVLILSLLPTFIVALGGGLWMARRSKQRVERITETLQALSAGDLAARVGDMDRDDDDLYLIGEHVNRMAARQQSATEALRQVSADIAHDLKTPIQRVAVLLNQLEERPDLSPANAALAARAKAEADGIVATFQSLLQIAQIEGGSPKARFTPVDLTDLARTFAEIYEPSAEDKGQELALALPESSLSVMGDKGLLGQALANLLENALRHTPEGSRITVALAQEAGAVRLEVRDSGPGIPQEERDKVLRRLYRLERSRTTPGNGLGLALVSVIAELHEAKLTLGDACPGLSVTLDFPPLAASNPAK